MRYYRPLVIGLVSTVLSYPASVYAQTLPLPTPAAAPMLDRSATLALKVPDYNAARLAVLNTAQTEDAELMDAHTQVDEKGRMHGWLRLQLPASRMPVLLAGLHPVGKLYAENIVTTDQLSDYEQLQRRVNRLHEHEQRLDGILQSPRRMRGSDILYLQERLFRASVDESLLSQQRVDLSRGARDSTLLVELFEPGTLPPGVPQRVNLRQWFAGATLIAHAGLDRSLARAATASAYAAVYAPIWAPLALLALLLLILLWRYRRRIFARLWPLALLAYTLLIRFIIWLRGIWDARHQPIGGPYPPATGEEFRR